MCQRGHPVLPPSMGWTQPPWVTQIREGQTANKGGKGRGPEGAHALRGSCWGRLEAIRKKTCFQFPAFASDLRRLR